MKKYLLKNYDYNTAVASLEAEFNAMFDKGYEVYSIIERNGLNVLYVLKDKRKKTG
jgi:hypothetical protein